MDNLWLGWGVGSVQGLAIGVPLGVLLSRGKAFFYRFVLKKTPIEPVIIGTGKISVPTKKIEGDMFEFEGFPYIAPPERMIPKSLLVGSVSAVYMEKIPMPLYITHKTIGFKLTDNTILSDIIRAIMGSDALKKLFTKEKVTNFILLIAILFIGLILAVNVQLLIGLKQMFPQLITEFNSSMETMRDAVEQYLTSDAVNTANPKGPTAVPPPPGG